MNLRQMIEDKQAIETTSVNKRKTEQNVLTFLQIYKEARMKAGYPREPKVTSSFSLTPPAKTNQVNSSTEDTVIANIDAENRFKKLDQEFEKGYTAISDHRKDEFTERRKKIFWLRYMQGLYVLDIADRVYLSKDIVIREHQKALIQFATALDILVEK